MTSASLPLGSGTSVPRLALRVFRGRCGLGTYDAVRAALRLGYRHIDTASIYRNEAEVGAAVRDSGIARREIFLTTKLWNDDQGSESTRRAFEDSLTRLSTDYVDLFLLHWPVPVRRLASWRVLEELVGEGRCRAIGVSNFQPSHLDELLASCQIPPALNQIELHPFLPQRELVAHCQRHGIVVAAYSPLTKGRRLDDGRVRAIAGEVGGTPAQVLLRWGIQKGYVVVAKSSNEVRLRENLGALSMTLDDGQMQRLDALEEGLRTAWDPSTVP